MGEAPRPDLPARLASELDRAGTLLEQLATQLCLDPIVFDRHAASLQQFDHLTQIIAEIAAALRHAGPAHTTIAAVRLDAMRERLIEAGKANVAD